jgi:hypothetical protein
MYLRVRHTIEGRPIVSADLAGQPGRLLVERAGEHDHVLGLIALFWPLLSSLYGRPLTPALHK